MPNGGPAGRGYVVVGGRALMQLKDEGETQVARYPGGVTFARIPMEQNGVADELAKEGARACKALLAG